MTPGNMRLSSKLMASQKVQYLRCAASLGISRTPMYAAFLGICDALILNFLLCHPETDFLRGHQNYSFKNTGILPANSNRRASLAMSPCFLHVERWLLTRQ